jgi:hypothetical protein
MKGFPMRYALLAVLPLCACVMEPPAVSGFNGNSVAIQSPGLTASNPGPEETALANETCAAVGKRARLASNRMVSDTRTEHLFLCV